MIAVYTSVRKVSGVLEERLTHDSQMMKNYTLSLAVEHLSFCLRLQHAMEKDHLCNYETIAS